MEKKRCEILYIIIFLFANIRLCATGREAYELENLLGFNSYLKMCHQLGGQKLSIQFVMQTNTQRESERD